MISNIRKFVSSALTLFVTEPMLRGSDDTLALNTGDNIGEGNTSEVRVRSETFPVAATVGVAAERSS